MKNKSKKRVSYITLLFQYSNQIFNIARGLVLVPIYLNFFSLSMYGAWLATGNIVGMLAMFDGGMNLIYSQKLSKSFSDKKYDRFTKILASGIFISLIMITSLILVGLLISQFVPNWVNANTQDYHDLIIAFRVAVVGAALGILYQNLAAIIASWLEATANGLINLISIIFAIGSIVLALYNGFGIVSIPIGSFAKGLVGCSLSSFYIIKKSLAFKLPKAQLKRNETKELVIDTLPMTLSRIGGSIVNQSQYLIISNFINPTITAVYALTVRTFMTVGSFIAPIASSVFNSVAYFDLSKDLKKIKGVLNKIMNLHGAFSALLFGSVLSLNHAFINLWVGSDKYGGDLLSLLTLVALFLFNRFNFYSTFLLGLGIIKKNALAGIGEMILRLVLIFALIIFLDDLALPISQIVSTSIILLIFYRKFLQKDLNMSVVESLQSLATGFRFTLVLTPISLIVLYYNKLITTWGSFVLVALIIFIIYVLIILLMSKDIRQEISSVWNRVRINMKKKI